MSPRPSNRHQWRPLIVQAALMAISERGFQDTRISDIAERAGTTPPVVLYHFDSKEEILEAAVALAEDNFYAEVERALGESSSARERLLRLLDRSRDQSATTVATWNVWVEIWSRALRNRHTARTRQLLDRRWRATLADTITEGQTHGEFAAAADPELVALMLASLMDGLSVQVALDDAGVTPDRMAEVLVVAAERMLECDLRQPQAAGPQGDEVAARD
jgi:AcrR family transcriptional regulator